MRYRPGNPQKQHCGVQRVSVSGKSSLLFDTIYTEAQTVNGFQVGLVNTTRKLHGLQVGLYNSAVRGLGLQVGLINHAERSFVEYLPVLNFVY